MAAKEVPMIVGPAIQLNDRMFVSMAPPHRHDDLVSEMNLLRFDKKYVNGVQGFVTDDGKFVTRYQGYRIALRAGQLRKPYPTLIDINPALSTEDLW